MKKSISHVRGEVRCPDWSQSLSMVQQCNLLLAGSWAASEMKCERTGDDVRLAF